MEGDHPIDTRITEVVAVHQLAFPEFFMTRLGSRFLSVYYETMLRADDSILVYEFDDQGAVAGFAAGYLNRSAYFARLKRRKIALVGALLPVMLSRPSTLQQIWHNVRSTGVRRPAQEAELASLAVRPDAQGRGLGARLVSQFERKALLGGKTAVMLTTDTDNNDAVNRFYERCGYQRVEQYLGYRGRRMNRYVKPLSEGDQSA